jgi:hypothetical protein
MTIMVVANSRLSHTKFGYDGPADVLTRLDLSSNMSNMEE